MTDKSAFTDDEWQSLTEAPLLVTTAVYIAGEHGPISMMKEATASARAISNPGEHGVANSLIGEIVAEANTKESRAAMKEHRGATPQAAIESALHDLESAVAALRKIPADESAEVVTWLVSIAEAVAASAKTVNPTEQTTIDKIRAALDINRLSA